ncbi:hypothetical protein [Mycoplasma sp. E35C]|uniref:hypothetical protein n=1 Tax=Mycoplasma sp. E35C TaxID=2801918 RepID=UPI001CA419C8|nr:hypothetical protein [Mycoplasma sp. E35C]QZX49086.1 hypothetical protein JJE79_03450 [Mycoplasma sp. E35C]
MSINDTQFDVVHKRIKALKRRTNFLMGFSLFWILLNAVLTALLAIFIIQYQKSLLEHKPQLEINDNKWTVILIAVIMVLINICLILNKALLTIKAINKNKEIHEHYSDFLTKANKILYVGLYIPLLSFIPYSLILKKANVKNIELELTLVNKKDEIKVGSEKIDMNIKDKKEIKERKNTKKIEDTQPDNKEPTVEKLPPHQEEKTTKKE